MKRFEIDLSSPNCPEKLRLNCVDPPKTIFGIGKQDLLETPTIGIIGARKATPYGIKATRMFSEWSASNGYTVVSGAAIGCDQVAHRAAIECGGKTIAVLGCGCDVSYPSSAITLLDEIRLKHLVISECPWGMRPAKWTFRLRNRIIAAISDHLLVAEAALPSGTFSTVDYKLNGNGQVFVVPGSIFSPTSRGCNRLLAQGAVPVCDISELAGWLGTPTTLSSHEASGSAHENDPVHLALLAQAMRPDDLAHSLGVDIVSVARRLSELEENGTIRRYSDGRYGPG